ncbi:MAG: hypothetical protein JXJ20_00525 [Anaerolineae bacterium]|jgi:hypothetical protein|nr:hypothetical protein [Anaerolineae bacterium]
MAGMVCNTRLIRRLIVGSILAVLLFAGAVYVRAAPPARQGTLIRYGDTVTGEITDSVTCQYYRFEGMAGDSVVIDMQRIDGTLDGVLWLYQRDGDNFTAEPVAFNDDRSNGELDPLIAAKLPQTDWYTIAACRLDNDNMRITVGTFSLTLTQPETLAVPPASAEDGPTPTAPPNLTEGVFPVEPESADEPVLEHNAPVTGQLANATDRVSYHLPVHAGDRVVIEWERLSGNLAPQIAVFDARGTLIALAATRDAASSLELAFQVPADGALVVVIQRYGGVVDGTEGDFELTATINGEDNDTHTLSSGRYGNDPPGE